MLHTRIGFLRIVLLILCSVVYDTEADAQQADEEFFPIMSWELPPRSAQFSDERIGLQSLADCGFTVAGFVSPDQLAECERLGLRAIVAWRSDPLANWGELSDGEVHQTVQAVVDATRNSDAVIGYFLTDEPSATQFPALAKAVAAVKQQAPEKLAYVNLFPDYATLGAPDTSQLGTASYAEYLDRFVEQVKPELISYDNYCVQFSGDLANPGVAASYFNNLLLVRKLARDHELPFWFIASSNQILPTTPPPSPANLLVQAYTTLAAGGRGLTWFTYYSGGHQYAPIDGDGNPTNSWSYLKMVNDQIKVIGPRMLKLKNKGVYFSSAPSVWTNGAAELPGNLVQSVECESPLMIGEFSGPKGEAWVMVVNLNLREAVKPKMAWIAKPNQVLAVSSVDGSWSPIEADQSIRLAAGQGVLLRLQ